MALLPSALFILCSTASYFIRAEFQALDAWIPVTAANSNASSSQFVRFSALLPNTESSWSVIVDEFCILNSLNRHDCINLLNYLEKISPADKAKEIVDSSPASFSPWSPTKFSAAKLPVVNLVSFPRSGSRMVTSILHWSYNYSRLSLVYCERYQTENGICPNESNARKSHDYLLNDEIRSNELFIVVSRKNRFHQLESYYRYNCETMLNQPYPQPCDAPIRDFFDSNRIYYELFRNKWISHSNNHPNNVLWFYYEDILAQPLSSAMVMLRFIEKHWRQQQQQQQQQLYLPQNDQRTSRNNRFSCSCTTSAITSTDCIDDCCSSSEMDKSVTTLTADTGCTKIGQEECIDKYGERACTADSSANRGESTNSQEQQSVWNWPKIAAYIRGSNFSARHTEDYFRLRYQELGRAYVSQGGIRDFWDIPGSRYHHLQPHQYQAFDTESVYFTHLPREGDSHKKEYL